MTPGVLRQPTAAWLVAVAVTAVYTVYSVTQWRRLGTPSWDLGIFTQLAQAYSQLEAPIVPIKGEGFNLLGDHFHPLLVLLGPVYAVFPSGLTLLVVQNVLFGLSVLVIARLGVRKLGTANGVFLGLAYGFSWGLQSAVAAQFHEIAFAVPLLALALEAVIEARAGRALVYAGMLVFVKEDLGLTVMAIGIVVALRFRDPRGVWLAAWGLAWLLLSTRVILPALNSSGRYGYSDRIDVSGMLADPSGALWAMVAAPEKQHTIWLLLVAGGLLFLRSPIALAAIPTLLWRFASADPGYWGPDWHYSAVLMPVVFAALVDAIRTARQSRRPWLRSYSGAVVPVVTAVALMMLPAQPLGALKSPEIYRASPRWDAAHRMMELIPDGASVESGVVLMPYLVPEAKVFWLGNDNPAPDYIVVDSEDWSWGAAPPADAVRHAQKRFPGNRYTLVFDQRGFQLVQRSR
jgi:uncharacterized membrane protein